MEPRVAICLPLYRDVHAETLLSMLALRTPSRPLWCIAHGRPVDEARNEVTARALEPGFGTTHILCLDGDVVFPVTALERLLKHDLAIVSGLYFKRTWPYSPLLMDDCLDGTCSFREEIPAGLTEVDCTGGGFLLVKREVFDEIGKRLGPDEKWWDRTVYPGGIKPGEDIAFCRRARAAGFRVMVDCDLRIGHRGEITYTQDVRERLTGAVVE